jgi:hypothetical protein
LRILHKINKHGQHIVQQHGHTVMRNSLR